MEDVTKVGSMGGGKKERRRKQPSQEDEKEQPPSLLSYITWEMWTSIIVHQRQHSPSPCGKLYRFLNLLRFVLAVNYSSNKRSRYNPDDGSLSTRLTTGCKKNHIYGTTEPLFIFFDDLATNHADVQIQKAKNYNLRSPRSHSRPLLPWEVQ